MPKYARFDHAGVQPAPVIGWYDTDLETYANLPSASDLLELTQDEWDGRFAHPSGWYVDSGELVYIAPNTSPGGLTIDQVLAGKISDGIAITSFTSPDLACTMALDATTMDQIGSVARDAASGLGLPADQPVFVYPDINGQPRMFSEAQVIGLYKAQRNLLFALNTQAAIERNGGVAVWPDQTATIP